MGTRCAQRLLPDPAYERHAGSPRPHASRTFGYRPHPAGAPGSVWDTPRTSRQSPTNHLGAGQHAPDQDEGTEGRKCAERDPEQVPSLAPDPRVDREHERGDTAEQRDGGHRAEQKREPGVLDVVLGSDAVEDRDRPDRPDEGQPEGESQSDRPASGPAVRGPGAVSGRVTGARRNELTPQPARKATAVTAR
jgi:hypothetical protein